MTIGKALEREVNNTPIGFLYEKTKVDGNPFLRVLRPSSLKGMNSSDRAPSGMFNIPDLPQDHFNKVQEAYNLWYQCWATSYLPLIMDRQKWEDEDPSLAVNDVVYFMLDEKALKSVWRIGTVDTVKVGRDGKVREVNVAYKILKEDSNEWTHNVVTRPVRKIIKLFELNDTTFADEMKAVHQAARKILLERGSLEEATATLINDLCTSDDTTEDQVVDDYEPVEDQPGADLLHQDNHQHSRHYFSAF